MAFGSISSFSTSTSGTSVAVSGSNPVGFIHIAEDGVSAITWGGVSMVKIGQVSVSGEGSIKVSVWWVPNPASSASIVITTSGGYQRWWSMYWTDANQISQPDSYNTGTIGSNPVISVATDVVHEDCWLLFFGKNNSGGGLYDASGSLAVERLENDDGGNFIADSNGIVSAGSRTGTMTKTNSPTSINQGALVLSLLPAIVVQYAISGTVTNGGAPVEGATVRCIRQSDNEALAAETTDVNGAYSFADLDPEELYHIAVEYEADGVLYNALSLWDVAPVEVG